MKSVRTSLFETNSSSMHSITVQDVRDKSHYKFENDDLVTIELDYYGRSPQKLLTTPEQKLSYILSYIFSGIGVCIDSNDRVDEFLDKLTKFFNGEAHIEDVMAMMPIDEYPRVPNLDEIYFRIFQQVYTAVRSRTNAKFLFKVAEKDKAFYAEGYEEMRKYLSSHNMEQLIFNPDHIIVIDGDEYFKYSYDRDEDDEVYGIRNDTKAISLLEDIEPDESELYHWETNYDFGDELLLNHSKPKDLTFYRLQKILCLDDLEPDYNPYHYHHRRKDPVVFKGIIYKGEIISRARYGYSLFREYTSIIYGKPGVFQITNEINRYPNNGKIYELSVLRKDGDYDRYLLNGCDVKIHPVKPRNHYGELESGYYLEFYEVE